MKKRFFVVIHTSSLPSGLDHVMNQTTLAKQHGADGVFIIPDYEKGAEFQASTQDQLSYLEDLMAKFPDFLIGVNFLAKFSSFANDICRLRPNLLQTDSASFNGFEKTKLPTTEFFCGIAFKYSRYESVRGEALREHCLHVASACDIPTTSGAATGVSADIAKIREIVSYLPHGKRLGIASGVTQDNVSSYLQAGVTDFLVATSLISHVDGSGHDILDPRRISDLAAVIHGF